METLQKDFIDNSKAMQLPDILHCIRVATLATKICEVMGIEKTQKEEIVVSAALHDVGKTMIDKEVLNKPDKLDNREWNLIKLHAEFGAAIASMAKLDKNIVKNILYHHEDYIGTGYPKRAKGSDIPLGAAIIRVCDTYDAIRTRRTYKESFDHSTAITEILKNKEKFNPKVLAAFLKLDFDK